MTLRIAMSNRRNLGFLALWLALELANELRNATEKRSKVDNGAELNFRL